MAVMTTGATIPSGTSRVICSPQAFSGQLAGACSLRAKHHADKVGGRFLTGVLLWLHLLKPPVGGHTHKVQI